MCKMGAVQISFIIIINSLCLLIHSNEFKYWETSNFEVIARVHWDIERYQVQSNEANDIHVKAGDGL